MLKAFLEVQNRYVTGETRETHKQRQNGPEQKFDVIQVQPNCWILLCRSTGDSTVEQAVRRSETLGRKCVEDEMWIKLSSTVLCSKQLPSYSRDVPA